LCKNEKAEKISPQKKRTREVSPPRREKTTSTLPVDTFPCEVCGRTNHKTESCKACAECRSIRCKCTKKAKIEKTPSKTDNDVVIIEAVKTPIVTKTTPNKPKQKTREEIRTMVDNFAIDFDKLPQTIDGVDLGIKGVLQEVETAISDKAGNDSYYKDLFRSMGFEYRRLATKTMILKQGNDKLKEEHAEKVKLVNEKQQVIDGLMKIQNSMDVDDGAEIR